MNTPEVGPGLRNPTNRKRWSEWMNSLRISKHYKIDPNDPIQVQRRKQVARSLRGERREAVQAAFVRARRGKGLFGL